MLLNRLEYAMMNNPFRAALQREFEAPRLRKMGGVPRGGRALEVGCGRGVGAEIVLTEFAAGSVDAFDLDPRMVQKARDRLARHGSRARVWVGSVTSIPVEDGAYDAVFDFGILHHVPNWRLALREIHRVLKPGGRLYAEEVLARCLGNPVIRRLFEHPELDRFDTTTFVQELRVLGMEHVTTRQHWGWFGWFTAKKAAA